jgi:hypothetical protein
MMLAPTPCQSSNSACVVCNTDSGKAAGPALKFQIRVIYAAPFIGAENGFVIAVFFFWVCASSQGKDNQRLFHRIAVQQTRIKRLIHHENAGIITFGLRWRS